MTRTPIRQPQHSATVGAVGGALGWSVITRLLQFGLSLIGSIIVVRALGPDRYGQLTVVRTALAFVTALCGLGLGQAVLRYLPTARARGDTQMAGQLLRLVVLPQFIAWIVAILVIAMSHDLVARISFPTMADLFLLGAVLVGAELAFLATNTLSTAFYDSRSLSVVILGGALSYLALAALALRQGFGVAGVLVATGLAQALMAAILARRVSRLLARIGEEAAGPSASGPPGGVDTLTGPTMFRYALPFAAISVMNLITWRQSESILLAHFRTLREAGFWDLAYRMPQMILEFIPGAIWPLLMAGFSEIYTRDRATLARAITVYYKLLFLLVIPIAIIGASVGDRAIVAFYGEEMLPAGIYCQLLFLVFSLSFFSTPMTMAFYVLEKPWYSFWQYLGNSIVLVGLDFLLIPRFGLTGALIPMMLVIAASPFVNTLLLRRLGVRPQIPWGFLGRVFLAAVPCALIYPARLFVHGKVPVALAVLAAGLLYLAGLRLFGVLKEEEAELLRRSRLPFTPWLTRLLIRPERPNP
ncbi:MAG: oligosaccharide flippase family protein [Candidatus Eisenbacteria bacterium]|nr:oligosaccharide flippase family protein [Candidatus Eisenbacteria bacterium]